MTKTEKKDKKYVWLSPLPLLYKKRGEGVRGIFEVEGESFLKN